MITFVVRAFINVGAALVIGVYFYPMGAFRAWRSRRMYRRYASAAVRAPHDECIRCGISTQPGPAASRCTECWQEESHEFNVQ